MGWRVVKENFFVANQPTIALWIVSVEIMQDHVNLLIGIVSNDFVDKIEKLPTSPPFLVAGFNLSCGHVQGCKEGGSTLSLIAIS